MTAPAKARFTVVRPNGSLDRSRRFEAVFNPTEYTLDKRIQVAEHQIPGLDSPVLQFVRGQNETLTFDLFFDTTADGMGGSTTRPVTDETDKFLQLVKIDPERHAPPVCLFSWGPARSFAGSRVPAPIESQARLRRGGFKCVVENIRQRFTLFSPRGVPLRATLTLTLREYKALGEQLRELNLRSSDQTHAHVVRQGETLSSIAAAVYEDPTVWRRIADWNGLADPLALEPGAILELPPIPLAAS